MKLTAIILLSSVLGSAFAQDSQSSFVTIHGKAATYLGQYGRSDSLRYTACAKGRRSPYRGTIECDLESFSAEEETRGEVTIFGFAARELFSKVKDSPAKSGIHCFVDQRTNGEREIGCKLKGFIVEKVGL